MGMLKSRLPGTSLLVWWLRLCAPNAVGPGSIPNQGTSSHMSQLRTHMPQLSISHASRNIGVTEARHSQINK